MFQEICASYEGLMKSNPEKGLGHFLTALKVFNIKKEFHHFLVTLTGFNFEKWLQPISKILKVFQNNYSVECWLTAASEGHLHILMTNELDQLWVPNSIALGIFLLFGMKFSWNKETDTFTYQMCATWS